MAPQNISSDKHSIFISYARDDDEAYAKMLWQTLEKQGFNVWWDRAVMESRGHTFLREIRDAIAAAKRVLLIVGPQVVHSPYVEMEWRHALREGVVVTPLLRLGDYEDVPEALQLLHCEDVRSSIPETEALENVRRIVSTPVPSLGPLVGVPRLPSPYLERPDQLDRLRSRVLIDSYKPIDLQPDQRITSLTGMGGLGKSVLAAALAQAPDVRRSFGGGIYWINIGRDTSTLRTLTRVGLAVGDKNVDRYTGVTEARLLIARAIEKQNCLLVLDDVWDVEVAEALHTAAGKRVRILLTSRKRKLFASAGVHEVGIRELSKDEALNLLADWTQTPGNKLPTEAEEIVEACGRLPLALSMIGATIRGRPDRWSYALERLRRADLSHIRQKLPDYKYETLDRAMLVSFEDLNQDQQRRYLDFVAVPEDAAAPAVMLRTWWTQEGMDELDVIEMLDDLVDRSLLRVDESQAYSLHDVQRDFLVMRAEDERAIHSRWLAAFAARTPGGWSAAEDDHYLFDHLGYHLRGADRESEWRELLMSFGWLERKTRLRGFPDVLLDLAEYSADSMVDPLHRVCRRTAHILTNDPSQLASQLLARMESTPEFEPLLEGARTWHNGPWLRPVSTSLAEEGEPTLAVFRGREQDGHAGTPRSITLSADGRLIASGGGSSNDLTVKVWSADAAVLLRTYERAVEDSGTTALAFITPDERLACASRDEISVYALDANEPIDRQKFDGALVTSICGGDGKIYAGFENGRVVVWHPTTDIPFELRQPKGDGVFALAHASTSPCLAIATASVIECRDAQDGHLIGRLEESMDFSGFRFQTPPVVIAPDGAVVYFGDPMRAWTVGESTAQVQMENIHTGSIVAMNENGTIALLAPTAHELTAVETANAQPVGHIKNSREFSCLALARDGRTVVTGDFEHDVKLWDLTRLETETPDWLSRGRVGSVAICDNNRIALVADKDGIELWDTANGALFEEQEQIPHDHVVRQGRSLFDLRITEDVRARLKDALGVTEDDAGPIVLRPKGPLLRMWEKLQSRIKKALGLSTEKNFSYTHGIPVGVLAFSLEVDRAVSATEDPNKGADMEEPPYDPARSEDDHPLQLWDLKNLSQPSLLCGHTMPITCTDMTADGTHALTGSSGRLLRLWDLDTGECLKILYGHRGIVFDCALSEDARLAISGSEDMTVRIWDLVQAKLLFTFAASSAVTSCDISRDGSVAIAAEISGRVHTFSVGDLKRQ